MTCGYFLFTSSMYICIRGRTVIYHKVMLWMILSKINTCFLSLWKNSILEPSGKVWSVQASNTCNLSCFHLDFVISCEMNWEVMVNPCLARETGWVTSQLRSILQLFYHHHPAYEQMLSWHRSEGPQLIDAAERERENMNCSRPIQVKLGFNPWIIQYFFSFTTVFLILYLSMLRNDPIVYIGNER